MTPPTAAPLVSWTEFRCQILENCRFFAGRFAFLEFVTLEDGAGNWTVSVFKTQRGRREELLSETGDAISSIYEQLHRKSARSAHNFLTDSGPGLPKEIRSRPEPRSRADSDASSDSDHLVERSELIDLCGGDIHSESDASSDEGNGRSNGKARGRTRKSRSRKNAKVASEARSRSRSVTSSSSSGSEIVPLPDVLRASPARGWPAPPPPPPPPPPSAGRSHPVRPPPPPGWFPPPLAQQLRGPLPAPPPQSRGLAPHAAAMRMGPPPTTTPQPPNRQQAAPGLPVRLVVKWIGRGEKKIIKLCQPSVQALQDLAVAHVRSNASTFPNASPADVATPLVFGLRATVKGVYLGDTLYDTSSFGGDDLSKVFSAESVPGFVVEVECPVTGPGAPGHRW